MSLSHWGGHIYPNSCLNCHGERGLGTFAVSDVTSELESFELWCYSVMGRERTVGTYTRHFREFIAQCTFDYRILNS